MQHGCYVKTTTSTPNPYPSLVSPAPVLAHLDSQDGVAMGIPLWIDALCINQEDYLERNNQVLLMGEIYRCAAGVISWLGAAQCLIDGVRVVNNIYIFYIFPTPLCPWSGLAGPSAAVHRKTVLSQTAG